MKSSREHILNHISKNNSNHEGMVQIMGGTIEETASDRIKRIELEKVAFKMFSVMMMQENVLLQNMFQMKN